VKIAALQVTPANLTGHTQHFYTMVWVEKVRAIHHPEAQVMEDIGE
jgi:hypothetical protein